MGIREVKFVRPERYEREAIPKAVRVTINLPREAIGRTVTPAYWVLPVYTGAGPCGTYARRACAGLAWSIRHLVEPLAAYYAAYVPPLRFGAKSTPRGRRFG